MGIMHQTYKTGENVPKWIVILRVVLGISLILKAMAFFKSATELQQYFSEQDMLKNLTWLTGIIPWIHLIGGILILVGLFTRLASLVQIPILFGAVIFVNLKEGIGSGSDLPFSFLILVLVIAFSFVGGGSYSLDNTYRKPLR